MSPLRRIAFAIALMAIWGCPANGAQNDAGHDGGFEEDAGVYRDAGSGADASDGATAEDGGTMNDAGGDSDAGPTDAGPTDAGFDAGPTDAGYDAGPTDAGFDAGPTDAGFDAGPTDAGFDAGPTDAGFDAGMMTMDAGTDAGAPPLEGPATIDGDLADWTSPLVTLTNPGFGGAGLFGPDNRFEMLMVDIDANYVYLGYRYRVMDNSCIIHIGTGLAGASATSAAGFAHWARLASFTTPIQHFVAQYNAQAAAFWDVANAQAIGGDLTAGITTMTTTSGDGIERVTEVRIPRTHFGVEAAGTYTLSFYAGIYGNDDYGGGDAAPNANSTPSVATTAIADVGSDFAISFEDGLDVEMTWP